MTKEDMQGLMGTIALATAAIGYFIYTDYTRPNIQVRHMVYDFYAGGETTDKYANALVRFYMNSGFSIEETKSIAYAFISGVGNAAKIDDASAMKNYFFCTVSLKSGEKIKEAQARYKKLGESYQKALQYMEEHSGEKPTAKFRFAFEKATGIGYTEFTMRRNETNAPLLATFQDCWKQAESKNLIAGLPYGINLP